MSHARERLLLATTRGLEGVLRDEAAHLGAARVTDEGVFLEGPLGLHRRANLELRTANRVWLLQKPKIDTSGELLYRRGFRQEVSRAPLRETIAAGILLLAGYAPETPLWDPLCGSGTLLIEAALLARNLAPGLSRSFAFESFADHNPEAFARQKAAYAARARPKAPALILGTDLNAGALGTARRNAQRAGVFADLALERQDATVPRKGLPPGTLAIANLPYGIRVGETAALPKLYAALVAALRQSGVARVALLARDPRAPEWLGLPNATLHPMDNGGLSCRLICSPL